MTDPIEQPDALQPADAELLELYLDGQLSDQRAAEAERRIAQVPAMQRAVELQERVDGALKQQFTAPAPDQQFLQDLLAGKATSVAIADESAPKVVPLPNETPASSDRRQRLMQVLAVAATLACASLWGTFGWDQLKQIISPGEGYEQLTVAQVYHGAVQRGFEPDWLCEDDQQFAQTFADRQGQGLLLEPLPEGVRMAGLAYVSGLTRKSTSMFAYVDGEPVLVMVGRTDQIEDSLLEPDPERGINIFTRQLDGLTLVEATPFNESRVLDSLKTGEVPPEPTGHQPGAPYEP